jgi:predicted nucleic acid-binding protein
MVADSLHVFLGNLPSVKGIPMFRGLLGHNQITDAYLLHLARKYHAVFLTFDRRLLNLADKDQPVEVLP